MVKPVKAHGLLVRGSLPLDALTFEKVVTSHEYVLVKFDTAYPFGDLHDEWKDIAKFSARNTELIAAEININQARLKDFPKASFTVMVNVEGFHLYCLNLSLICGGR